MGKLLPLSIMIVIVISVLLGYQSAGEKKDNEAQADITGMYIYHSLFETNYKEYKIDFVDNLLYEFSIPTYYVPDSPGPRNGARKNEGYQSVEHLDADKVDAFFIEAIKTGFFAWEDSYMDYNTFDGHQWGISIKYKDGSVRKIIGSNAYPESWAKMNNVFKNLTGKDVLALGLPKK